MPYHVARTSPRCGPQIAGSDIFAIGDRCLTKCSPVVLAFAAPSAAETLSAVLTKDPFAPGDSSMGRSGRRGWMQIVRHCLEKNPEGTISVRERYRLRTRGVLGHVPEPRSRSAATRQRGARSVDFRGFGCAAIALRWRLSRPGLARARHRPNERNGVTIDRRAAVCKPEWQRRGRILHRRHDRLADHRAREGRQLV